MIKVLYIVDNLREGGSQRYVAELARFGNLFGINPHVCSFEEGGHFYNEIRDKNIPILFIPVGKIQEISTFNVLLKLASYVRHHKIKIIHTFQTKANIIGTFVAWMTGIKVITSRRDIGDYSLRGSKKLEFFEKNVINRLTNLIMVNSNAVLNAALINEGIRENKVRLIYNTVDLERFRADRDRKAARRNLGLDDKTIVFGSVSGFRPVKGVDVLIRAASILSKKRQDFIVFIAGDGPERASLEQIAIQENVSDRIRFLGHLTSVEELHPAFDVFVLSSRSEGCSNALLEAQSSGLPVIATKVGGNPELVLEGQTGILVPSDDPEALAAAMDHIGSDSDERLRLGRNARRFIETQFSQKIIHRQLGEMYRSLLAHKDA